MKRISKPLSILTNRRALALAGVALAVTLSAAPHRAAAENASYGMPGDWLSQYVSARTVGMGGAFVAVADDPFGAT
jgi:hypothetical protein